ncbi:MAG TPA: Ada metal-binding domain-containing protein [Chitinophagaceae bacterium]|nr:Ada metal-binding domain-containing protein [Chitinophagaceae bacterium]
MIFHIERGALELRSILRKRKIVLGGNKQLKIYGKLSCKSGKRMKKENRVFFASEKEAISIGYRPCGHCMRMKYIEWKKENEPSQAMS